jgi:hypothetical protein
MTTAQREKLNNILDSDHSKVFIECACSTEALKLEVFPENDEPFSNADKQFYITYWSYGKNNEKLSFVQRVTKAWNVFWDNDGGDYHIILNEEQAYMVREFISRHLYDRDLLETLRRENHILHEELMKAQISTDYDRGLDHGHESSLIAIKKYFDEVISETRSGVSRLTTLLDGCLHKLKEFKQL